MPVNIDNVGVTYYVKILLLWFFQNTLFLSYIFCFMTFLRLFPRLGQAKLLLRKYL